MNRSGPASVIRNSASLVYIARSSIVFQPTSAYVGSDFNSTLASQWYNVSQDGQKMKFSICPVDMKLDISLTVFSTNPVEDRAKCQM